MWSRVRHRRLQALSLVALAALLTTSLCLGPLYQRAMEQALAARSWLPRRLNRRRLRISSTDLSAGQLVADLPSRAGSRTSGSRSTRLGLESSVPVPAALSLATRLYSASRRLRAAAGRRRGRAHAPRAR